MTEILFIQDNMSDSKTVRSQLAQNGMSITPCQDAQLSIKLAQQARFQVVLISSSTGIDSYRLCRKLRILGIDTPVLIIDDQNNVENLAKVIDAEADGLISRPINFTELSLRIQSLLRRTPRTMTKMIRYDELMLDCDNYELYFQERPVALRRKELQVFTLLMKNRNRVFTREQILNFTSEIGSDADEAVIDVHISNIRKQLKSFGLGNIIQTIHGIGYAIR